MLVAQLPIYITKMKFIYFGWSGYVNTGPRCESYSPCMWKYLSLVLSNFAGNVEVRSYDFWSERRRADGFVETAVGHYFWDFSFLVLILVVLTAVAKMA